MGRSRISSATAAQILIVLAAAFCGGASASAQASPECMTHLLNASDCVTYVSSGSKLTRPDPGCCPELAGLVEASPGCICYFLGFDVERGLNLTSACSLSPLPPTLTSSCNNEVGAPRSSEQMGLTGAPSSITPGATSQSAVTIIRVKGSSISGSALAQLLILSIPIAFVLAITI